MAPNNAAAVSCTQRKLIKVKTIRKIRMEIMNEAARAGSGT